MPPAAEAAASRRYAWYALGLLCIVYIFNFVDRQVISIIAEEIKGDLRIPDQDLGFLYGTAFGIFFALFGIPLGRLADRWHRVRLMSVGLATWSVMTALSGLARSLFVLGGARMGVAIGEATASPCAYSLISDYFPRKRRATALSIYSSGIYLGSGLALFVGGAIVSYWNLHFPAGGPLGLRSWQAAFLAVGLPGLLLVLWVRTLREPMRGEADGLPTPPSDKPFAGFLLDLESIVPPFTLIAAARRGGSALRTNLIGLAVIGAVSLALIWLTSDEAQWIAVGLGTYALFSWGHTLKLQDPPAFRLIVASPVLMTLVVGYGFNTFLKYSISFWASPYALREFHAAAHDVGMYIGGAAAIGGFLGVISGGFIADLLHERDLRGRIFVMLFASASPAIPIAIAFTTSDVTIFYAMLFIAQATGSCALGAAGAATQELVMPRMRATAAAVFFIGTTMIGLALGPYIAGRISTWSGDLATGVLVLLLSVPVAVGLLWYGCSRYAEAVNRRVEWAREAGEP